MRQEGVAATAAWTADMGTKLGRSLLAKAKTVAVRMWAEARAAVVSLPLRKTTWRMTVRA